jgi:hypothetical protein
MPTPVNNNTPNSNVTGTGNGTPQPTPIPSPTRKYTLQEVVGPDGLEEELQESINNYINPNSPRPGLSVEETEAFKQAKDEIVAVKKATISQLDSTLKELKFSEFGVGLKEHQEHTKSLLDSIIKQKVAAGQLADDAAKQEIQTLKNIQANLKAVHEARLSLLDEYQNKETDTRKKHAYGLLKTHWNLTSPIKGGAINTTDPTIDDHFQQSEVITKANDKKSWIQKLPNGCIAGTDPTAVGHAMADTNYKEIEFSGEPQQALKAAIAAFDAGAEKVSLSRETLNDLHNPSLFKSKEKWQEALDEYKALNDRQAARSKVKNSKTSNPVFDSNTKENKASDNFAEFNELESAPNTNTARVSRIQMLCGMEPIDVAKMAKEAKRDQAKVNIINDLYKKALEKKFPSSGPFSNGPKNIRNHYAAYENNLGQPQQLTGGANPNPTAGAPQPVVQQQQVVQQPAVVPVPPAVVQQQVVQQQVVQQPALPPAVVQPVVQAQQRQIRNRFLSTIPLDTDKKGNNHIELDDFTLPQDDSATGLKNLGQ